MRTRIKTIAAATLGCKVNFTETEGVLELFRSAGYEIVGFDETAAVYLINTCAVTNESSKKSRQMIAKAKKRNPSAVIAVIGCYSQLAPDEINADIVIGTNDRGQVVSLVEKVMIQNVREPHGKPLTAVSRDGANSFDELPLESVNGRTRAFIKIQDGCENFCAYCIIPYARGSVRSRKIKDVTNEIERLVQNGCKEVVLSGIHIASYGKDVLRQNSAHSNSNEQLIDVINATCAVDGVERVRLGSLDPAFVTSEFVTRLSALNKVCPHFHLPLQSGSDRTLKRMNRRYDRAQYSFAVGLLRAAFPNVSITSDIIAGFPGETDEDFEEGYSFIELMQLSRLHVFPFSKREGTTAASMDGQNSAATKKARAQRLIKLGEKLESQYKEHFINKALSILIEEKTGNFRYRGLSENYLDVCVTSEFDIQNKIMSVIIGKNDCFFL